MKDIRKFILEKYDWWTEKDEQLISKNDLIKFAKEALKQTKLDAEEMQNQLSQYEDPDDLDELTVGGITISRTGFILNVPFTAKNILILHTIANKYGLKIKKTTYI